MSSYNYTSNSHKSKEQSAEVEKRANKVIKSDVKTRANGAAKLADLFISEDAKNVKSYILTEVLVPLIKNAIVDAINKSANMIFFGGAANRNAKSNNVPYVSYNSINNRDDRFSSSPSVPTRMNYRIDDFVFTTRVEAEEVLAQMDGILETYKTIRVLDFYDLIGRTCDQTAARYGWTSTRDARIEAVRGGYVIRMPRAMPID